MAKAKTKAKFELYDVENHDTVGAYPSIDLAVIEARKLMAEAGNSGDTAPFEIRQVIKSFKVVCIDPIKNYAVTTIIKE